MTASTVPQPDDWVDELIESFENQLGAHTPYARPEIRQHIKNAIRSKISEAEAAARIDEWSRITTYIDESYTFDWYPADFKAFRDKRLAELQARQATKGSE